MSVHGFGIFSVMKLSILPGWSTDSIKPQSELLWVSSVCVCVCVCVCVPMYTYVCVEVDVHENFNDQK